MPRLGKTLKINWHNSVIFHPILTFFCKCSFLKQIEWYMVTITKLYFLYFRFWFLPQFLPHMGSIAHMDPKQSSKCREVSLVDYVYPARPSLLGHIIMKHIVGQYVSWPPPPPPPPPDNLNCNRIRRSLYLHRKHATQIFCNVFRISICTWNTFERGRKAAVLFFLCEKHTSVSGFCQGASRVIFNDPPLNFGRCTSDVAST